MANPDSEYGKRAYHRALAAQHRQTLVNARKYEQVTWDMLLAKNLPPIIVIACFPPKVIR